LADYDFHFEVIWRYRELLAGALLRTLTLGSSAMVIGGMLGLILAYLSTSKRRLLRSLSIVYVDAVRNTPLLLLVFMAFLVLPQLGFRALDANQTFVAALSVVASGYVCENLRAAFASMPKAYVEAAMAIGLRAPQRQIYVVLPIALRYALPSLTNSAVAVLKDTSLASIIAVRELTFAAREISINDFRVFEAWIAVGALYLAATALIAAAARLLERRLSGLS
jgi:His/Glu/Gln/Arg/opine family amino acid ABC transporter permease subunit